MPLASIVIPCYNAATFVRDTVQSARDQTMGDLEIICVDDGSTDDTRAVLEQLAQEDPRIHVISQENGGEGPARDAGLQAAKGDWLYFLDSDDLMEPTLLEEAIAAGQRDHADVVVFRTILLDAQTGATELCPWSFKRDWMPDDSFHPRQHPDRVLNSFQNWVHNKLFRGSFVRSRGIAVQHVHRTADLYFTCRALAEASRITLLDVPLHQYRVNNPQSAAATSDTYPLDFYEALLALRAALEEAGVWETYHTSFVNWAIENVAANLRLARTYEGYRTIADTMIREGFERLDIAGFDREDSDMPGCYDQVMAVATLPAEEALYALVSWYRTELDLADQDRRAMRRDYEQAISDIMGSASMRIGRAATSVPRMLRDRLSHNR